MTGYDAEQVTTDELEQQQDYFERIYLLDQVGGLDPGQMLDDDVVASYVDHEDQLEYDLERLEDSIDELPDEYGELFHDIEGFAGQLDSLRDLPTDQEAEERLDADEFVERVEDYVEDAMAENEELGFATDNPVRLFNARAHEISLRRRYDVPAVDPTYVLDVLEE
ncbi:MAG: hypothetical protein SV186_05405 [Candidatus Nanohaloarchaea archaeon]|nr:hypothetical protein [Candidatus Nanohaloarchaea archaeon]